MIVQGYGSCRSMQVGFQIMIFFVIKARLPYYRMRPLINYSRLSGLPPYDIFPDSIEADLEVSTT